MILSVLQPKWKVLNELTEAKEKQFHRTQFAPKPTDQPVQTTHTVVQEDWKVKQSLNHFPLKNLICIWHCFWCLIDPVNWAAGCSMLPIWLLFTGTYLLENNKQNPTELPWVSLNPILLGQKGKTSIPLRRLDIQRGMRYTDNLRHMPSTVQNKISSNWCLVSSQRLKSQCVYTIMKLQVPLSAAAPVVSICHACINGSWAEILFSLRIHQSELAW